METETTNHQDVAEPDQIASGTAGTGQENEELEWMRRHGETASELAERKTGLRGQGIDPVRKLKRSVRSRTERDLLAYDSDIPYAAFEKANRNLVCSLIERQDLVTESLLLIINDLQYRVDDLECSVDDLKNGGRPPVTTGTGTGEGVPE